MNLLDAIIALTAIVYAVGGFRSGAVVSVFSLAGFIGFAYLGVRIARPVSERLAEGRAQVPIALVCVLVAALIGQALGLAIGVRLRDRMVRGWARPADAAVGAVLGVVAVLLVGWMVSVPLASSPYPRLAQQAAGSRIVRGVDQTLPDGFRTLYLSLRTFLDRSGFPPVLGDLPDDSVVPVAPPPADLPAQARSLVAAVHRSVLKIYAQAPGCDRQLEGSGFVFAPHRVLTNAHVVAGSDRVTVQATSNSTPGTVLSLPARVVSYDPRRDVAVLAVPRLDAPALPLRRAPAATGEPAVVLGYPGDGPYTSGSARVRDMFTLDGRDIYDSHDVSRTIYSIRATVRSGNSGGPLLDYSGRVVGMVFATSLNSPDTGYVLTSGEIRPDADAGIKASTAVGTQDCTRG